MHVLYLHQFDLSFGGGSGVYLRALSVALGALGHTVDIVTARSPDPYGCTTSALPFDFTLTFGPEKRAGERTLDELGEAEIEAMSLRAADSIEVDLLHARLPDLVLANHINLMALVARHLGRRHGVPYRILSHGTDTKLLLRDARYVRLFADAAHGAERIFTISERVAAEVRQVLGAPAISVLGGAVDHAHFFLPSEVSAPAGSLTYVGRLVTEKGLWPLIHAVESLDAGVRLTIVGEGPLRPELEAYLAGSASRERIRLTGYVPPSRLRALLVESTLVVVPSVWEEPLGLVVLEAMACGVPVVASAVGGIPEMLRDGVDGVLVPPGDARLLGAAIARLFADEALLAELRRNVREKPIPTYRDLALRVIDGARRA